jgi:hypothetical protein
MEREQMTPINMTLRLCHTPLTLTVETTGPAHHWFWMLTSDF